MIGAMAISPNMLRKPPVNIQKDLLPISQTTTGQMLLAAGPDTSFKSVKDVIAHAKQNPDKLFYASSGNGTPGHVGFELFKFMTGTQIVHVPYKGGAAGIADLIAGQVQLMLESTNSITPFAKSGRVRALAVTSARSARRRCRTCRPLPKRACPATKQRRGPASSRRSACRSRSWRG